MVLWLGALAALLEDPGLNPSIHQATHNSTLLVSVGTAESLTRVTQLQMLVSTSEIIWEVF